MRIKTLVLTFLLFTLTLSAAGAQRPPGPQPPVNTYASAIDSTLTVAGDIFCLQGSDTKTIYINAVTLTGTAATAAQETVSLVIRSSPSVGASNPVVPVPYDQTSPPATAIGAAFTAAPTVGTPIGVVRYDLIQIGSNNGNSPFDTRRFLFDYNHAIVLRGSSQALCVNLVTPMGSGASMAVSVEHTEY